MSTVKISELPLIDHYSTNTEATLVVGVDLSTGTTGKSTLTTLGEGLYANQPLKVGQNQVLFANTIGQFSGNSVTFLQINNQNFNANGSADYVASTSDSDNLSKYIDVGINGSDFSDPIYSSMKPYDGYLYVYGASNTSTSGNLVVGTASSFANIVYIVGGTTTSNIVARMTKTDLQLSANYNLKFGDGSIQYVAASPANYSQAAYAQANVTIGVDATQNTNISSTDGKMQSAYNKANSALANTAGVYTAGDFNISGNLTVLGVGTTGVMTINAAPFAANTPAFRITGTANGYSYVPLNQGYMIQITGFANTSSRIVNDAWGANTYPAYIGRQGRGSALAPASTANGDIMLRIAGNGWGNSFSQFGQSRIDFVATENFTDSSKGTEIQIWNTTIGTNTISKIATFNANEVIITGQVKPLKGFVWYPRTFPAAQTAITVDFSADAVIRANIASGLTVSFSNYTDGKVVDLWITNTSGSTQTFTHGCTALNSTVNATTYNIPGTSSIFVKYISFDGDIGNTFCAITHA